MVITSTLFSINMNVEGFLLIELLKYQFFQNALIGGLLIGILCAWVGLFLMLRKESMIVDGTAHTAFGGLALGLLLGIDPFITALITSIISVFSINYMKSKGLAYSDSAIAFMFALGISIGLVIISLTKGFTTDIFAFLFGSILTISREDVLLIAITTTLISAFLLLFQRELLIITFNEEDARIMGVPVRRISILFNLIVAITIIFSIKMVGVVLVAALMVIPSLIALQLKYPFNKTLLSTIVSAIVGTLLGIIISTYYRIATSAAIVLTLISIYIIVVLVRRRW